MIVLVPLAAVNDFVGATLDDTTDNCRRCRCLVGAVLLGNNAVRDTAARTRGWNVKLVPTPQVSLHTKVFPTLENTPSPSQLSWISLAALVAVYPDWHVGVHVSPVVFWLHDA